jgi:hypothetical protein
MELTLRKFGNKLFVDKFQWNFVEKEFNRMAEDTKFWYEKLCREFYIEKPWTYGVGMYLQSTTSDGYHIGATLPYYSSGHVLFAYNLAFFAQYPDHCYGVTIPHEVAHGIADQIFPEETRKDCHGKEWQEVMQYLNLPPLPTVKVTKTREEIDLLEMYTQYLQSCATIL